MKSKFLFSAVALTLLVAFTGCNLGGKSNYTPRVSLYNPALLGKDSALIMKRTTDGNIKIDSLFVNDTVTVMVLSEGFTNDLVKLDVSVTEPGDVEMVAPHDSVAKYFGATSDFTSGKIVFLENIAFANYPFQFVTKKVRDKVKINFVLTSDAEEVSNTSALQLEFQVKP